MKLSDLITLRKNSKLPNVFDVEMHRLEELQKFSSVECHLVLYPYSRKVTKNDYSFNPFEEYIGDIAKNQKSAYHRILSPTKEFFGIFLGVIILLAFLKFKPSILVSVESIVGIFGAYFIGKDLWDDLEHFFIDVSKDWSFKYQDNYYSYEIDKGSTLTQYSCYAKKQRYGISALIPDKMEFIEHHNSSTARLYFKRSSLAGGGERAHLFSISLCLSEVEEFEKAGYLFGAKISMNKKFLCFEKGIDFFQSISKGKRGCLDRKGNWLEDTVHYRKILRCGRIKLYLKKGYLKDLKIIS